ncbi:MAG: hypothetical protein WCU88_10730 [Elusimicrobiota bacterium]
MNRWLRFALFCVCAWGAWRLWEVQSVPRTAALVLDAGDVSALCAANGYPETAFYERARTIGFWGTLVRPWTLEEAFRRGKLLHFTRKDVEKMRRLGLLAPKSPLQGDSLWSQDRAYLGLLGRMLELRGVSSRGTALSGRGGLLLSEEMGEAMRAGYDLDLVERLRGQDLIPLFQIEDSADAEAAVWSAENLPAGLWVSEGVQGGVRTRALEEMLSVGGWVAFEGAVRGRSARSLRRAWLESSDKVLSRALSASEMPASGGIGTLRRRLEAQGDMLVHVRVDPRQDVETAFDLLRPLALRLKEEGFAAPQAIRFPARLAAAWEDFAGLFLLLLLCVLGPFLSLRTGLSVSRSLSRIVPEKASPVLESFCGAWLSSLCMLVVGSVLWVFFSSAGRRLGLCPSGLGPAVHALILLGGLAALYSLEPRSWLPEKGRLRWAFELLFYVGMAVLLCSGRAPGSGLGLRVPAWDWLFLRWPEAFIGQAAVFAALALSRGKPGAHASSDPRPMLLIGLLALGSLGLSFGAPEPFLRLCGRALLLPLISLPAGLLFLTFPRPVRGPSA